MRLTCPSCGATTSLEAAVNDKAARQVAALFGRLPPQVAAVVPEYLALFRPAKTGLRWSRVASILDELVPMVEDGFKEGGRRCKPSAAHWRDAIHQVANRDLTRPLANHNYLKRVVAGLAESHAAEAETAHHQALRAGQRPARQEQRAERDRVAEAIDGVLHRWQSGFITEDQKEAEIAEIKGVGSG